VRPSSLTKVRSDSVDVIAAFSLVQTVYTKAKNAKFVSFRLFQISNLQLKNLVLVVVPNPSRGANLDSLSRLSETSGAVVF
jgi:hypothetical protein